MSQVVVQEPFIEQANGRTIVRVDVTVSGGRPHPVEFVLPPVAVHRQQVIDAMFVCGRLIAMKGGWQLVLPGPVSGRLLDRAEILQDVLQEWFGKQVKPMPLDFEVAEPLEMSADRGVLSTFSGGVDSYYTVLENLDQLSGVLFIHGLDIGLGHTEFRTRVSEQLRKSSADLGVPLWEVETDIRSLTNQYAAWGKKAHGAILASVAILLAQEIDTFLIPGTLTRAASKGEPWGSHVLIDRLHSTDYLSVVHHGADTTRPEKTARIAQSESALRNLRVCYSSRTDYNCGSCSKCRRTQVDLELAGVSDADWIFAQLVPLETALAQYRVDAPIPRAFAEATITQARSLNRTDVTVPLRRATRRYDAQLVKRRAMKLRRYLRKDPEFRTAFVPKQNRRQPPPLSSPPTMRAVLAHRLPDPVMRRLRWWSAAKRPTEPHLVFRPQTRDRAGQHPAPA